ncbi:hypothetical protein CB1_000951030 [Camelus ferus]|nr:hypothetical protein CB1_000951030 [Camelus ferus]
MRTLHPGEVFAICGSCEALGNWNPQNAVALLPENETGERVKLTLEGLEEDDDDRVSPTVLHKMSNSLEIALISDNEFKCRHSQPECGYGLQPDRWTEYSIQTMEPDNLELIFDFFEEDLSEHVVQGDAFPGHVGTACLLSSTIAESGKSAGILTLPIMSRNSRKTIGRVRDICTMVRQKQNKYPILFLTQGKSDIYPELMDLRSRTTPIAMSFAQFENLLGINAHTEDLLRNPSYVQEAKAKGLVIFCWGDDTNDPENRKKLKEFGVNGLIYDRIYDWMPEQPNIFQVEQLERLKQELPELKSCLCPTVSRFVPSSLCGEPDIHVDANGINSVQSA